MMKQVISRMRYHASYAAPRACAIDKNIGVTHLRDSASRRQGIEPATAGYVLIFCVRFFALRAKNRTQYGEEYRSAEGCERQLRKS